MKRIVSAFVVASLALACGGGDGATACPKPEVLSGTISGEVHVGETCSNWVVTSSVTVPEGAKLVIHPGTELTFSAGAALVVRSGIIEAIGTEDLPILLTGAERTPGFWAGVALHNASSTENKLAHVTIEYGGSKYSTSSAKAGLTLLGASTTPSRIEIVSSTVRHSSGHGLALDAFAKLPNFNGNTLTSNSEGAAAAHLVGAGELVAGNAYTGNDKDRVVVHASELRSVEVTLHDIGVPFQAQTLSVLNDGKLVLAPSTTLAFESGARLYLNGGGILVAEGTAERPIVFTGVEATPGFWQGLIVHDAGSTENVLAHVTVEFAGVKDSWASAAANVALTHASARLEVRDSTLRSSAGYGLYVDAQATLTSHRNLLTDNALGAGYAFAGSAHRFDADSSYVGNAAGRDFVRVARGTLSADVVWQALDAPYRLEDVDVRGHLTLEPGVTVEMDAGKYLRFATDGRLSAVGTPTAAITFRGTSGADWNGLQFQSSVQDNRLEYANVSDVGPGSWSWSQAPHGAVRLYQSKLSIAHSRFVNNEGYGVWQSPTVTTVTGCDTAIFEGNTAGDTNKACI